MVTGNVHIQLPQGIDPRPFSPGGLLRPGLSDVDFGGTVGSIRGLIAEKIGYPGFNLHLKLDDGSQPILKRSMDTQILSTVGVKDGSTLRVANYTLCKATRQAELRITRSVKSVGNKVDDVKVDTDNILGDTGTLMADTGQILCALRGGPTPQREGQSAKDRLKEIRLAKRLLDNEAGDLRESEGKRLSTEKRQRNEAITASAEMADGAVAMAVDGGTLVEKKAAHKAQGKVIAAAGRTAKAVERKLAKAAMAEAARVEAASR